MMCALSFISGNQSIKLIFNLFSIVYSIGSQTYTFVGGGRGSKKLNPAGLYSTHFNFYSVVAIKNS